MQVTLPEMGESVTEGTVAKWLKQPGDSVREGEALVEVTTDKVDAEIPAPASGKLLKILAEAGQTITVGAPLAEIEVGTDGDKTPTQPSPASGGGKTTAPAPSPPSGEGKSTAPASPAPNGGQAATKVEITEGAELLARAKGIDLATVKGSGPGGSIRRRDVAEAIERQQTSTLPAPAKEEEKKAPTLPAPAQSPTGSIPLRGAAAALVKYMEESLQVPAATSFRTVRGD